MSVESPLTCLNRREAIVQIKACIFLSLTRTRTQLLGAEEAETHRQTQLPLAQMCTHTNTGTVRERGRRGHSPPLPPSNLPVQLPILSENKPSVSDPGPIRSETEAHWLTREAARFRCGSCDRLLTPAVTADLRCLPLSLLEPKGTCVHTHTFILLLCHCSLTSPTFLFCLPSSHSHPSLLPPFFLFFFIFCFFIKRCCLRYYLCYTNQINRRHFSFKG